MVRRFVMATAFAMTATERNTDFGPDAKQALPKNKKLIVYCGLGGTLKVPPPLHARMQSA